MGELTSTHSDGIDHPLAHDAGVNHSIHSTIQQRNNRAANFVSRRMIGDFLADAEMSSQTEQKQTE